MATTYSSAEAIADIPKATYDALTARFKTLAVVQDVLGAERKALRDEMKRREDEDRIRLRLGALSSDDKATLKTIVNAPTFSRG